MCEAGRQCTFSAWNESRPEVGSSQNSRRGLPSSSMPMLSRLRSPPLSPRVCAQAAPKCLSQYLGFNILTVQGFLNLESVGRYVSRIGYLFVPHHRVRGAGQPQALDQALHALLLLRVGHVGRQPQPRRHHQRLPACPRIDLGVVFSMYQSACRRFCYMHHLLDQALGQHRHTSA